MSDISKSYFSESGSCFWVAESEGQVVGMVGALPVKKHAVRKEQLELFHLWGLGAPRTSALQYSALALYQRVGFQKTGQFFFSMIYRLVALPCFQFTYRLPSAQVSEALGQAGGL
ncbi:N-acetyltransferase 8 [Camelus dromedarius]|uniref:N-acetyltransferase 8 n=1 Tax=Camelus dromedarius TaxID=9838 RepID=A0A5N4D7M6_CAMDR|nr:N-acetyltransferase 8 [Camelus dromedarius]